MRQLSRRAQGDEDPNDYGDRKHWSKSDWADHVERMNQIAKRVAVESGEMDDVFPGFGVDDVVGEVEAPNRRNPKPRRKRDEVQSVLF